MKKQILFLSLIFLFLITIFIKTNVNASSISVFTFSPTPLDVTFHNLTTKSYPMIGYQTAIYNITVYQSMQYYFYCTFYVDEIASIGGYGLYASEISTIDLDWNTFDVSGLTLIESFGFGESGFNFIISPQYNSSSTVIHKLYFINIHDAYLFEFAPVVLDITYIQTENATFIDLGFGLLDLPSLIILVAFIFVPSLLIGIIFNTEYNLGFIGFFCGLNITTTISYEVSIVPLWLLIAVILVDSFLILKMVQGEITI